MASNTDPLRLLYIDDSMSQLFAVKSKLQSKDVEVAIASDLFTAERLVEGRDLIIVDYHLSNSDGAAIVAQLKRQRGGEKPLFYLYTADRNVAADYSRYGFDGAFTQKGSLDELARQVGNVAKLIRMRRALPSSPRIRH
jgi:response regulator RpfG family c-di-GMP phosphodiesterase